MVVPTHPDLTAPDRETLKAISLRQVDGTPVRPGQLVADLGVSPATITARLKRLHELRLAEHIPYAGVTLTEDGRKAAVIIVRRHRIVERFLVDTLGYSWDEAESLAPSFEHAMPAEVVQRLYVQLEEPATCPHGFPIPHPDDESVPTLDLLVDLEPGEVGSVAMASNTDRDVVTYLAELGIHPGVPVRVVEKLPFDGPVTVLVDGAERTLGNKLARMLSVSRTHRGF